MGKRSTKKRQNSLNSYMRVCRDCGTHHRTEYKDGKYCEECKTKRLVQRRKKKNEN